jgi:hypothetical protein
MSCRFVHTHPMFHDVDPHMSGVVSLLRPRKELIPRGMEQ